MSVTKNNSGNQAASDFTLYDLGNKPFRFSDLKGKVAILDFWATWCPLGNQSVTIEEFSNPGSQSKLLPTYNTFKKLGVQEIVCDFCAGAFGVKEKLNQQQCPLLSEYKGHPSIEKWIKKGYQLLIL